MFFDVGGRKEVGSRRWNCGFLEFREEYRRDGSFSLVPNLIISGQFSILFPLY